MTDSELLNAAVELLRRVKRKTEEPASIGPAIDAFLASVGEQP
jgi:hypothetical protein